jgi:hypothetical protein
VHTERKVDLRLLGTYRTVLEGPRVSKDTWGTFDTQVTQLEQENGPLKPGKNEVHLYFRGNVHALYFWGFEDKRDIERVTLDVHGARVIDCAGADLEFRALGKLGTQHLAPMILLPDNLTIALGHEVLLTIHSGQKTETPLHFAALGDREFRVSMGLGGMTNIVA